MSKKKSTAKPALKLKNKKDKAGQNCPGGYFLTRAENARKL